MTFETDSKVKNFLTTDRTVPVVRRLRGCEHFIKRKTIKCVEFVMSDQSLIARGDADVAIPVPPAMRLPSASGFGGRQTIARAILWTLSLASIVGRRTRALRRHPPNGVPDIVGDQ
jgi:hypothetical protein